MRRLLSLALVVLFAGLGRTEPPANRLARESSPYLLQHAHNPVDWYPWGPEAFARAAKENRLVFLSIGYSSCHWCHVMEREAFSDAAVAKLLNENFICIKVDREERPDIDQIYMLALNMTGHPGGWPLSMFLTPDGKPIVGGTYWPIEDKGSDEATVPGFKSVLGKVIGLWRDRPDDLREQANRIAAGTTTALRRAGGDILATRVDRGLVQAAVEGFRDEFDGEHGGFGSRPRQFKGPKFPMPTVLSFLLSESRREKSAEVRDMVTKTLDRMAHGGIFDQVGGGFHRYSTERTWTVPHFEKMLYDNAQLVEVYAAAFAATGNPEYRRVVEETLKFVSRELTDARGGCYSALDADSDGAEGQFYVWTEAQLLAALPDKSERELARRAFGADGPANFEGKASVLTLRQPMTTALEAIRAKLLAVREARKRPFLDKKVLTGWNGQMIAAWATAGVALKQPEYTANAVRAAEFVLATLRDKDGRLLHSWIPGADAGRGLAFLDDYAFLVHGLLNLHEATGEKRWLDEARTLTDAMIRWHGDEGGGAGAYFTAASDAEKLFARARDQHDGVQPSGNSAAARNLVRLARLTGERKYRERADALFAALAGTLKREPTDVPTLAEALSESLQVAEADPKEPAGEKPAGTKPPLKSDGVVKIEVTADKPDADGKQLVTVTLQVEEPWHLYANPVGNEMLEGTATRVRILADGKPLEVTPTYPKGKLVKDELVGDYLILEGKVTVTAVVPRPADDKRPLEVEVRLTACKEGTCLLPATVRRKLP